MKTIHSFSGLNRETRSQREPNVPNSSIFLQPMDFFGDTRNFTKTNGCVIKTIESDIKAFVNFI
jgi:hypothetical protein